MSITPYGYDIDNIDAPKFVSRGEWDITGTVQIEAYTPLKANTTMTTGDRGLSGHWNTQQWAEPYNDISGISGCIGISIRKIFGNLNTGGVALNQNVGRRKMGVMHEGIAMMRYQSGTLDGSVITMKYGDDIAPCTSGFRTYEEIQGTNYTGLSGLNILFLQVYITGYRQCHLGWYADVVSSATGTRKRVRILTHSIRGNTK